MKNFEKWWDTGDAEKLNDLYEKNAPHKDWAKAAYRAALEWALSLKEPDHTDIFYVINPILIEKELNDGSS